MMKRTNPPLVNESAPGADPDGADLPALRWMRRAHAQEELLQEVAIQVRHRRGRRLAAATGLLAVLIALGVIWRSERHPEPAERMGASPRAGNATVSLPQSTILPDGSVVELKEGARIVVDFSGEARRVVLRNGAAHFQVAKNAQRPFVVSADEIEVRAVGTAFLVDLGNKSVEVLVTEGRVQVRPEFGAAGPTSRAAVQPDHISAAPSPTLVEAGNLWVAVRDEIPRLQAISEADLGERLAWRIPRLEFSRTPLAEVVALMNRHAIGPNKVRFVVADPNLNELKLSGFLKADNTEGLRRMLEANFGVRTERAGDAITLSKAP